VPRKNVKTDMKKIKKCPHFAHTKGIQRGRRTEQAMQIREKSTEGKYMDSHKRSRTVKRNLGFRASQLFEKKTFLSRTGPKLGRKLE